MRSTIKLSICLFSLFVTISVTAFAWDDTSGLASIPVATMHEAGDTRMGMSYHYDLGGAVSVTTLLRPNVFMNYAFSRETEMNLRIRNDNTVTYTFHQMFLHYDSPVGVPFNDIAMVFRDFGTSGTSNFYLVWSGGEKSKDTLRLHFGARWVNPFLMAKSYWVAGISTGLLGGLIALDCDGQYLNAGLNIPWPVNFFIANNLEIGASGGINIYTFREFQLMFKVNYFFNTIKNRDVERQGAINDLRSQIKENQKEVKFLSFFVDEYLYKLEKKSIDYILDIPTTDVTTTRSVQLLNNISTTLNVVVPSINDDGFVQVPSKSVTVTPSIPIKSKAVTQSALDQVAEHYNKSYDLVYQKKYYQAIKELKLALEINANEPELYKRLASIYYMLNLKKRALEYMEQALILDPADERAQTFYIKLNEEVNRVNTKE